MKFAFVFLLFGLFDTTASAEILWITEGNRLHRIDLAEPSQREVHVEAAAQGESGGPSVLGDERRDVNGMICALPDGSGDFLLGEDTGQPDRLPGWGIFTAGGEQRGKLVPTYREPQGEPFGCAFDAEGRLFTTSVGARNFTRKSGQLILWFPPFEGAPAEGETSANFCKLATNIGAAGGIAIDAEGRVYVSSSSRGAVFRFSPPFPTGPDAAGGCGKRDETGAPLATAVQGEVFARGLHTFSGLAFRPDGHLYAASNFTGSIVELDREGEVVRRVLEPDGTLLPFATGTPQGIALDASGTLYYADLGLHWKGLQPRPGPEGKVWRIRFDDAGAPLPPEVVLDGLAFPDGVAVTPGSLR